MTLHHWGAPTRSDIAAGPCVWMPGKVSNAGTNTGFSDAALSAQGRIQQVVARLFVVKDEVAPAVNDHGTMLQRGFEKSRVCLGTVVDGCSAPNCSRSSANHKWPLVADSGSSTDDGSAPVD